MAILEKLMGTHRDLPQIEAFWSAGVALGTGNDFEHNVLSIPNLAQLPNPPGAAGMLPSNDLFIRSLQLVFEANVVGAATNNFALNFRQYRNGVLHNLINSTSSATITAGSNVVVTPTGGTGMAGIQVGMLLNIAGGVGAAEYVTVSAITPGISFTIPTLANTHSGAYTMTCSNISSIYFNAAGVTATAWKPLQCNNGAFTPMQLHQFLPGDVLTVQRQSFGTGLASPAFTAMAEWVALYNNTPRG